MLAYQDTPYELDYAEEFIGKAKRKVLIVLAHSIAWLALLSLPALFRPHHTKETIGILEDIFLPIRMPHNILFIAVFYFNYYVAIPKFYLRRQYLLLALSVVTFTSIFFLINYLTGGMPHNEPGMMDRMPMPQGPLILGPAYGFFMFIIVYVMSFALCLYSQWRQINDEKLNTEISFLKAQINPHFLFNTLNSIYSLALTKSDATAEAVVKLSGMMRYSVSEVDQLYVSLDKEINYIRNYIDLQTLRLTRKVKIVCNIEGTTEGKKIAPFVLIPFIENAFKHGINEEENSDIQISIYIGDGSLRLQVLNNRVYVQPEREKDTGLGIKNTRQRLELLYPGRHTLVVTGTPAYFNVSLNIRL